MFIETVARNGRRPSKHRFCCGLNWKNTLAAAPPAQSLLVVSPWAIALTVMLATFMEVPHTSVANVFVAHRRQLSATIDESTWVLTSHWFLTPSYFRWPLVFIVALPQALLHGLRAVLTICLGLALEPLDADPVPDSARYVGGGAMQPISQAILVVPRARKSRAWRAHVRRNVRWRRLSF